jgi:hypothetical protein
MAHWAELDENNTVLRVLVGDNNDPDEGYQWLIDNLGGTWVKTSYNTRGGKHLKYENVEVVLENGDIVELPDLIESGQPQFRKNFAGIGFTYDTVRDAFIPPKPTEGDWKLNEETCLWETIIVE